MKDCSHDLDDLLKLYQAEEVDQALEKAEFLLSQYSNHIKLQQFCSVIFIDFGTVLKEIEIVNKGVSLLENILKNLDDLESQDSREYINYRAELEFNLSNGYSAQADLLNLDTSQIAVKERWLSKKQEQKRCLQNVLLWRKQLPKDLLSSVMANYANLLRDLGRYVEAIDYYYDCLIIAPNHALAMGNCGSLMQNLLNFSSQHNTKILYEVWRLMKEANQRPSELARLGGKHIISVYKNALEEFEKYLISLNPGGAKSLEEYMIQWEKAHSWRPSPFLKKVKDERLLLTVNPRASNCPSEYKDDIVFQEIVIKLDAQGEELFESLSSIWNNIKEEFATARYLYYQGQSQDRELLEISKMTLYVRSFDWDDWGLRSGLLKASLRLTLDLFDKCAGFLNLYLELGHPEEEVSFSNVWYNKRTYKKGLLKELKKRLDTNSYLAALYDIKKDLAKQQSSSQYPYPFKDWRNTITHLRFTLFLYSVLEYDKISCGQEEFTEAILFLLRIAKATIIYLVGVVMIEENQRDAKRKEDKNEQKVCEGMPFALNIGLSDECDS